MIAERDSVTLIQILKRKNTTERNYMYGVKWSLDFSNLQGKCKLVPESGLKLQRDYVRVIEGSKNEGSRNRDSSDIHSKFE